MNIIAYTKSIFERALVEPDVNSRLVFLLHGVGSIIATIALTVAFIVKPNDTYPFMVGAVAGGSLGAAAGRYMTKKQGGGDAGSQPQPQPSPKIGDNA